MKTNGGSAPNHSNDSNHPPLARDAQGNLIARPDGTAGWCLKRETGGRPKMIVGQDRQAARFALDLTRDDIEAMLGPGTYRVYAINQVGEVIDYVTTAVVGEGPEDDQPATTTATNSRGGSSDLRFALETILQMARAQSDSLKAVSEAQADWVKGLATAKALPRNSHQVVPPPPPVLKVEENDDKEADDEDDEAPGVPAWVQAVNAIAPVVKTCGELLLKARFAQTPPAAAPARNAGPSAWPNPMIHLSEVNAQLTGVERKFLNLVLRGEHGPRVTEVLLGMAVPECVAFVKDQVARARAEREASSDEHVVPGEEPEAPPPTGAASEGDFMGHVLAGSAFLTAEERAAAMWLLPKFPAKRIQELTAMLMEMSPRDAAMWIKEHLEELRGEVSP